MQEITARLDRIERQLQDLVDRLNQPPQAYVSRREYAERNGISLSTVDRAIRENRLAIRQAGRRVLIDASAAIKPN